jgi:hypothetical protein
MRVSARWAVLDMVWLLCLVVEGGELRATEQGTAHCSRRAVVGVDGFVGGAERPVGVLADQDAVGSYQPELADELGVGGGRGCGPCSLPWNEARGRREPKAFAGLKRGGVGREACRLRLLERAREQPFDGRVVCLAEPAAVRDVLAQRVLAAHEGFDVVRFAGLCAAQDEIIAVEREADEEKRGCGWQVACGHRGLLCAVKGQPVTAIA